MEAACSQAPILGVASTMSDGEGDEHNVSRNPPLTRERQMQLLLLSPEMLARRCA